MGSYQKNNFDKLQIAEATNAFPNINVGFGMNENQIADNVVINVDEKLYIAGKKEEAKIWVDNISTTTHTFIVFGLGMGWHIEMLIDKFPESKIFVIEPDKRVLAHAMHLRDMEKVLKHATIWLDESIPMVKGKIHELLTQPLARGVVTIPFYSAVYTEYSSTLYAEVQKMMNDWAVMLNTKRSLVSRWYGNRIKNLQAESVNLASLIGKFKGVPGIIVGAGASLEGQLEKLKSLQGKAVIIAASTAAEILKTHGIKPTFMVAIDQDPVTSGALHENMDGDTPLIWDGQIAQNSLKYKGKKFQMLLNVNRFTNMVLPGLPVIESGPSVANVAMDLLYKFGCDPILIMGLDMSYTKGKLYCDGTKFNKEIKLDERMLKIKGVDGEECYTEPSFLAMRNWYEEYINRVKPPVFNCTAKGIPIVGAQNKSLNDDFDDFKFSVDYNLDKMIDDAYYKPRTKEPNYMDLSNVQKINSEIINELDAIKETLEKTKTITPQLSKTRAWFVLDEFISTLAYLNEIRLEYKISQGKDKAEVIKEFQEQRNKDTLEQIDILKNLLSSP